MDVSEQDYMLDEVDDEVLLVLQADVPQKRIKYESFPRERSETLGQPPKEARKTNRSSPPGGSYLHREHSKEGSQSTEPARTVHVVRCGLSQVHLLWTNLAQILVLRFIVQDLRSKTPNGPREDGGSRRYGDPIVHDRLVSNRQQSWRQCPGVSWFVDSTEVTVGAHDSVGPWSGQNQVKFSERSAVGQPS